jgi:hypothetical protein
MEIIMWIVFFPSHIVPTNYIISDVISHEYNKKLGLNGNSNHETQKNIS